MPLEELVKSIRSPEGVAHLFDGLGYKPELLRMTAESLGLEKKQKEGISEIRRVIHYSTDLRPNFQVYYFNLKNFSRSLISAITRKFSLHNEKYLLVFSDKDFSKIAFSIFVKLFSQEKAKPQVRILTIERDSVSRTDLDIINGFSFEEGLTTRDLFQKITNSLDIKKVTKPFFREYRDLLLELQKLLQETELFDEFEDATAETRRYAQLLLGRLMFLYFVQKKGWLNNDREFIEHLFQNNSDGEFFNQKLNILFYETLNKKLKDRTGKAKAFGKIPFLNGGLFEKDLKYQHQHDSITVPNSFFGKLIQFFNSYNFTVEESTPLEVAIAIDPEMLGRVFENLLAEEERGKKGTFYTPRAIVHYMCRESLKEYLISESKIDKPKVFDLFEEEKAKQFSEEEKEKLLKLLKTVKVIDPAVGSGAFPVGMMHEIIKLRKFLDSNLAKKRNDYNLKKEIIQNNLYGVDIEPEAIEICRLRHWLTLVVDDERVIEKIEPLPNLDYKFVVGNSLVDTLKGYSIKTLFKEGELEKFRAQEDISFSQEALPGTFKELENRENQLKLKLKHAFGLSKKEQRTLNLELKNIQIEKEKIKPRGIKDPATQAIMFGHKEDEQLIEEYHNARQDFFNIKPENKEKQRKILENYEKIIFKNAKDYIVSDLRAQIRADKNKNKKKKLTNEILEIEKTFERYKKEGVKPFFLPQWEFKEVYDDPDKGGFNIVIANPPYASTKKVSKLDYRDQLEIRYNFVDDLYVHFTFRAFDFARDNHGIVCFITSDTYFTITTKHQMREFLQSKKRLMKLVPTPKAFEATVNTAIFIAKDEEVKDYSFTFIDARELEFAKSDEEKLQVFENLKETRKYSTKRIAKFGKEEYSIWLDPDNPLWQYDVDIRLYKNCIKKSFFTPSALNVEIYNKCMDKIVGLYEKWWDKIKTSKDIEKNKEKIQEYLQTLKPGDTTLLGLISEGGQGLATGDNSRFLAVLGGTFEAKRVKEKIKEYKKKSINYKQNSRFIWKTIPPDQVIDYTKLNDEEKANGIASKEAWIIYEKGDKEGNKWIKPRTWLIDWSKENVSFLKSSPEARWQGYSFFFKEGFSWTDVYSDVIKCRVIEPTVNDVKSMKLHTLLPTLFTDHFFIALLNSSMGNHFVKNFISHENTFQIGDARQFFVIVSDKKNKNILENLIRNAIALKMNLFSVKNEKQKSNYYDELQKIQSQIDSKVAEIYGIDMELKGKK